MKWLIALVAVAAGATGIVALGVQAASAAPGNSGYARDTVCVVHLPNNTWQSCLDVTVNGSISSGRAAANGSIDVSRDLVGADKMASIQIDRVAVGTQHTSVANSGSVNSGRPPKLIRESTSAVDPYYQRCDVRYHVVLDYSVRLTSGLLKTGTFTGPWFDSNYGPCAGFDYGSPTQALRCVLHYPQVQEACLQVRVAAATSNDGKSFYARGTITVPEGPDAFIGNEKIARIQVDSVVLGRQSAGVRISPSMNSRDRHPLSAMGQTSPGFAWSTNCTIHYQAALNYSVRLKDGRLFTGRITTPLFKAPGCAVGG
jgi:hypothetical protein